MKLLIINCRRPLIVGFHILLIMLANYLAFWIRFDGVIPPEALAIMIRMIPWLILIRGLIFIPFRLYEGLWRYTSILELRNIIAGVGLSTVVFYLIVHQSLGLQDYPRSIFFIDTLVLIFLMGGVRLSRRLYLMVRKVNGDKKVLIYGAGDAGEMIVRDMISNGALYHYKPVGFVDDNRKSSASIFTASRFWARAKAFRIFFKPIAPTKLSLPYPVLRRRCCGSC